MLDLGWAELAVIGVIALIVIGPRDLPRVLYSAGKMAGKARSMLRELQQGIEDIAREAELDDVRKKIEQAQRLDVRREIEKAVDPTGEIGESLAPAGPESGPAALDPEAEDDLAVELPPPRHTPAEAPCGPDEGEPPRPAEERREDGAAPRS